MAPEGWRVARLGEVARVNPEQLRSHTDPNYVLEYLDVAGIPQPGVLGPCRTLTFAEAPSRARRRAQTGDILVSTVRPYLRSFAYVRAAPDNLVASTGYAVVRPTHRVDGRFLYQHVLSERFVQYLQIRMTGSNYPAVRSDDVQAYKFHAPPLPEQRKIAAILSSVDDAIEKTQAVIDQVQIVKRGLLYELLTPAAEPAGARRAWKSVRLADLAEIVGGGTPSRSHSHYWNGSIPWATPTDVTGLPGRTISRTASAITQQGLAHSSATLLPPHSLLMTTRATIGACAITRVSMATNQGFQSLVPKTAVTCVTFLYYLVQRHERRLERLAAGSTFLEVPKRAVREFRVVVPPLPEQHRIAAILSSLDDTLEKHRAVMDALHGRKNGLTSALLTGTLRVTPGPDDP